ncbi:DNA replication/repair protein RecF [Halorhodospira halochloris]|uniref:DNA replication/repair protein RecF n=1 Tax=Halorhodospira halochloris TaxID=1052 RepID=UPI00076F6573|nr:DNA replication and repair protein RecF [Halorhodospira halochloris]MBK1650829.1 hypothetical protein [Halorhodospira halochloris]
MNKLDIGGFRNIHHLKMRPNQRTNIIVGDNAAGKTSFLEAIFYLSRLRSFRTQRLGHLINWSNQKCHVFAKRGDDRLGVTRSENATKIRVNGMNITSRTVLAKRLPVQLINTEHQRLILDGPKVRRNFLDWGAFHVDNKYRKIALRYQEALRQRNAALRYGHDRLAASWIPTLAESAAAIDKSRRQFIDSIHPLWAELTYTWLGIEGLNLTYIGSSPEDGDWLSFFYSNRARDSRQGYTCKGPHRADLRMTLTKTPVAEILSRGQQKLLVVALLLAEVKLWADQGLQPLLLIDDLAAELDIHHLAYVMQSIANIEAQVFLTAIDSKPLAVINQDADWYALSSGCLEPMRHF